MASNEALLLAALLGTTGSRAPRTGADKAVLADAQDARELRKVMSDLEKKIQTDVPGLSKKSTERVAELYFGISMALGDDCVSEVMLADAINKVTEILVAAKVEWAIELIKATYDAKFKPAYDSAVKAGVDPVVVLQANFQMTRENAQKLVDAIRADEKSGDKLAKEK